MCLPFARQYQAIPSLLLTKSSSMLEHRSVIFSSLFLVIGNNHKAPSSKLSVHGYLTKVIKINEREEKKKSVSGCKS